MQTAIVTGAAGFIGSHLTDTLLAAGYKVIGVDNLSTGRLANLKAASKHSEFTLLNSDISDLEISTPANCIFHLAGRADLVPSIRDPEDYFRVNVEGTFKMLQLARKLGVKKFLYAASSTCYGIPEFFPTPESAPCKPEHPYGLTKYIGEQLVMHWGKVYGLNANSLRLFNVYGPRSRTSGAYGAVFGVFLKQKLAGVPFTVVGDGTQTRDFTFVKDVAEAFLAAAESAISDEIINVGSGQTYTVNQLVNLLGGNKTYIPKRPGEPDCTFADTSKIVAMLNWQPKIQLEEGVAKMVDIIQDWKDAPLWTSETIEEATKPWFEHLGKK